MRNCNGWEHPEIRDFGGEPFLFNLDHAANMNQNFRTTLWTGRDLQMTLMSIPPRGEIGMEMHDHVDQFLYATKGCATVFLGCCPNGLREAGILREGYGFFIPAGTWHNVVNCGKCPLKLYSLYAPPQHPAGTVHQTKADAEH